MAAPFDLNTIANYNPSGFALANQERAAQIPLTQAQTAETQARVPLTQAQVPLVQQQTQAAQLENQQRQQALKDYSIFMQGVNRNGGDPSKALNDPAVYSQMSGQGFLGTYKTSLESAKALAEIQKAHADATKTGQEIDEVERTHLGKAAQSLIDAPGGATPSGIGTLLTTAAQISPTHAAESKALLDRLNQDPSQAPLIAKQLVDASGLGREIAKENSTQGLQDAEKLKNLADAATQVETKRREGLEADIKGKELEGMSADYSGTVDKAITDPRLNASTKALVQAAPTLQGKQEALRAGFEKQSQLNLETNPAVIQSRINAEVGKQVALAKLSPQGFSTIQDPSARRAAETAYEKDSNEYADKVGAAQQLQAYVQAAQSGNKAAPGLIPLSELRAVVSRVNRNELQAVSGAGSLKDKVEGWLKDKGEGQPIPPDVLKDIASLSQVTQQAARRTYEYKVHINNATHGGSVQPIDLTPTGAAASSGPTQIKDAAGYNSLPSGTVYIDPSGVTRTKK